MPSAGKALEQSHESLPSVAVAIVVGSEIRQEQERRCCAGVLWVRGGDCAQSRPPSFRVAEGDLSSRALVLSRGSKSGRSSHFRELGGRISVASQPETAPSRIRRCRDTSPSPAPSDFAYAVAARSGTPDFGRCAGDRQFLGGRRRGEDLVEKVDRFPCIRRVVRIGYEREHVRARGGTGCIVGRRIDAKPQGIEPRAQRIVGAYRSRKIPRSLPGDCIGPADAISRDISPQLPVVTRARRRCRP